MLRVVDEGGTREEGDEGRDLDELAREGARRMLVKALEVEVSTYLGRMSKSATGDTQDRAQCL
jgi:hypothetical protein